MTGKEYKQQLSKLLYSLRWEHRFSQQDLSDKCGIMAEQLTPMENGRGNPTMVTLAKIAAAYDMKLSEFFAKLESKEVLAVKQKGKKKRYF